MSDHYSDLEVVHHKPETNFSQQQLYSGSRTADHYFYHDKQLHDGIERPEPQKRMLGLRARTFWIVVAVVVFTVIAVAVGGGVGGSLSSKSHTKDTGETDVASSTTANTSATSTTSNVAISTTTVFGPSETLLVDCPSSNYTLFTPPLSSQTFRKVCGTSFINQLYPGDVVNARAQSLDSCISLCAAYNVRNASEISAGHAHQCDAVCWRDTIEGDDWPGYCFGYTSTNVSGSFNYGNDTRCNSAALIN